MVCTFIIVCLLLEGKGSQKGKETDEGKGLDLTTI
jgi:hypothetical protein